jgi:glutathione synthase/RimK-type ligase-like ATP-grasp enzyme
MDLSTILMLQHHAQAGLGVLAEALRCRRTFELQPRLAPRVRLLALMTPGDLMANAPLGFLVENSDIALTLHYLMPGEPVPRELPAHDVLIVAISQMARTDALLLELEARSGAWTRPLLNRPAMVAQTCRSQAFRQLAGSTRLLMMPTARVTRDRLEALAQGQAQVDGLLENGGFPLIVRPVDSHAGHGLEKLEGAADLRRYLDAMPDDDFFLSRFVDYRSADGLYRKCRVVLIDGRPFPAHMGVSAHWMIHYLNAGMTESAAKRADEAHFMDTFDEGFASRHAAALQDLHERLRLDYLVIDCAETVDGELLVFEVDPGAVVHSMDPVDLFPYKPAHMERIYAAFRTMVLDAAARAG